MSAVFSSDQVLACTESATSEYSTTSQCATGPVRESQVYPERPQMEKKKTNAPITPIRLLPGDSSPLVVINTADTRGGEEIHSRGGGGQVRKDTSPVKINNKKTDGENRLDHGPKSPPMANHGTKPGV
jgi:hypothetical protein